MTSQHAVRDQSFPDREDAQLWGGNSQKLDCVADQGSTLGAEDRERCASQTRVEGQIDRPQQGCQEEVRPPRDGHADGPEGHQQHDHRPDLCPCRVQNHPRGDASGVRQDELWPVPRNYITRRRW